MRVFNKLFTTILVVAVIILLSALSAFAAEKKEFYLEQDMGYSQSFTVTNTLESAEGLGLDFFIKAQAPAIFTCDFIFSNIKIIYENEEYSDDSQKPISAIVKESEKTIIPDGEILPQHYTTGYTIEFDKPGQYSLEILHSGYSLTVTLEITQEGLNHPLQNKGNTPVLNELALPTSSKVLVNDVETVFEAYTINNNNYFKLRDLAKAVSGTDKQFEVSWDGFKIAINLIPREMYTAVGGEMEVNAGLKDQNAVLSTAKVYIDTQEVQLQAYTISDNNYFKLRDVAKMLDIGITWDGVTNTISIDTSISYTE